MNTMRKQGGFTLIELMIVIAILAILMAIAIPAYQDYSIRAKVSECVNLAASAKLAVSETALSTGKWPDDSAAAGYEFNATDYCTSIVIDDNVITATTQNTGAPTAPILVWTASAAGITAGETATSVEWDCTYTQGSPKHIPSECRNTDDNTDD